MVKYAQTHGREAIFDDGLAGLKAMKAQLVVPHQSFNLKDLVDLSFWILLNVEQGSIDKGNVVIEMLWCCMCLR